MSQHFTLLWQPDDTRRDAWLTACGELPAIVRSPLILLTNVPARETVDHKAAGAFAGVVFNDLVVQPPLVGRGAVVADHVDLALHAAGWGGPQGLASLRWQGTLAVMHVAQRMALVARDLLGVGGLYWATHDGGHLLTNHPPQTAALGVAWRLVPPGTAAMVGPAGVAWQPLPCAPDNRAWYRDLPEDVVHAQPEDWLPGLQTRLDAAVAATQRAGWRLQVPVGHDEVGRWLAGLVARPAAADPNALWSLAGADAWLGHDPRPPEPVVPGPWPVPEPPELVRVAPELARVRWVRAGWLPDVALEAARLVARAHGLTLVAPHLDPAVVAWLGAMPAGAPGFPPLPPSV